MPDLTAQQLDAGQMERGFHIFDRYCTPCHGAGAVGGGVIPDLRYSGFIQSAPGFRQVVVDGLLSARGMVDFGLEISAEDAEAIRAYLISRNQFTHEIGDTQRLSR